MASVLHSNLGFTRRFLQEKASKCMKMNNTRAGHAGMRTNGACGASKNHCTCYKLSMQIWDVLVGVAVAFV